MIISKFNFLVHKKDQEPFMMQQATFQQLKERVIKNYLKQHQQAQQKQIKLNDFKTAFLYKDQDGDYIQICSKEDLNIVISMNLITGSRIVLKIQQIKDLRKQNGQEAMVKAGEQRRQMAVAEQAKIHSIKSMQDQQNTNMQGQTKRQQFQQVIQQKKQLNCQSCSQKQQVKQIGNEECLASKKASKNKKKEKKNKKNQQLSMLLDLFEKKISITVSNQITNSIPCIIQQVQKHINGQFQMQQLSQIIHSNVKCNGCSISPISGVRYKCPQCAQFNLCEKCEQKIDHTHFLLKMKRCQIPQNNKKQSEKQMRILKKAKDNFIQTLKDSIPTPTVDKKILKKMLNEISKQKKPSSKIPKKSSYCQEPENNRISDNQIKEPPQKNISKKQRLNFRQQNLYKRNLRILMNKFGVEANDQEVQNFICDNIDIQQSLLCRQYRKFKNIPFTQQQLTDRIEKIKIYFEDFKGDFPKNYDFAKLVHDNPNLIIKQLLQILKNQGYKDIDPSNERKINMMKRTFNNRKKTMESWKKEASQIKLESKRSEQFQEIDNVNEQSLIKKKSEDKYQLQAQLPQINQQFIKKNSIQIRQKGKILLSMLQIFGQDRKSQIFKFIQIHYPKLNEQQMVTKYLSENFN